MKFQYYHGTSSIFLESILKYGLGGVNPNFEYGYLNILKKLYSILEKNKDSVDCSISFYETTQAMAMQTILIIKDQNGQDMNLNFKHDGIYVTLSLERAAFYATMNRYGSEILSRCMALLDLFDKHQINYDDLSQDLEEIVKLRGLEHKPIIIKVLQVDEDMLDKEDGKTAKEALDMLRGFLPAMSEKEKFRFFQQCNFKILEPIPPQHLQVYEADFEGKPGRDDFDFTMSRIK